MNKKGFVRLMALSLALLLSIGGLVGCSDNNSASTSETSSTSSAGSSSVDLSDKRIAFISASNQYDFFVYMGAKVQQIAKEYGITVDMFDAEADVTKEIDLMSQCITQGYDCIIVGPVDSEALVASTQEAIDAGILVINYDSYMEGVDVYARIGSDNEDLGRQAGEYAVEYLTEKYGEVKGNITILTFPSLETMNSRTEGFISAFDDYPDVTIKEESLTLCDAETGQALTDNLLIANGEGTIDIIFGANAGVVIGANSAVESAGRSEIAVIGIDDEQGELDAISEGGTFKATVAQDGVTIGEESINAAIKALQGEKSGDITVPGTLVTTDNVDEFLQNVQNTKDELESYK